MYVDMKLRTEPIGILNIQNCTCYIKTGLTFGLHSVKLRPLTVEHLTAMDCLNIIWSRTSLDRLGPHWTTLDRLGPPWTAMDRLGPPWTTLERLEPPVTDLDQFEILWSTALCI